MSHVEVFAEEDLIFIRQQDADGSWGSVCLTRHQIPTVCEWLKEAASEAEAVAPDVSRTSAQRGRKGR